MLRRERAVCPVVACGERREAAGAVTAVGVERKYRRGMWKTARGGPMLRQTGSACAVVVCEGPKEAARANTMASEERVPLGIWEETGG